MSATKRTCRGSLTMSAPEGKTDLPREPGHFRFWLRLCENSDFELSCRNSFSITMDWKRTALPVITERRKGKKQFCAFSARARFYTASKAGTHSPCGIDFIKRRSSHSA